MQATGLARPPDQLDEAPAERAAHGAPGRLARPPTRYRPNRTDRIVLACFAAAATATFAIPAAFGRPLMPGDDILQNYPMRVLSGQILAEGHLPAWDVFAWSGSPLLAGWNAASFYPLTLLFAILPPLIAWVVGEIVTATIAATGLYILCRVHDLAVVSSALAALSFVAGGQMSAQFPHVDLLQSMGWAPWILLALRALARHVQARSPAGPVLRWTAALALLGGIVILTGSTRGINDVAILAGLYALWIVRPGARRVEPGSAYDPPRVHGLGLVKLVALLAAAALGAIALGAVQWEPGLAYLHESQRAHVPFWYYDLGALPLRWTTLLAVPTLLGGDGSFGGPAFAGNGTSNVAEMSGYAGALAIGATIALAWRWIRRVPDRHGRDWGVWIVVTVVGIVLAWGGNTPIGRLLYHIPLYGGLRLASRNMLVADFGLAMSLAFFLDGFLRDTGTRAAPTHGRRAAGVVLLAASVLALAVAVDPAALLRWSIRPAWELPAGAIPGASALRPWIGGSVLILDLAALLIVTGRRIRVPLRSALVAGLVCVDLLYFDVTCSLTIVTPNGGAPNVAAALALHSAATAGHSRFIGIGPRTLIYDQHLEEPAWLVDLGWPDLNVLTRQPSAQGYASLTPGSYDAATGTHYTLQVNPSALADGTFIPLDVAELYALADSFVSPGPPGTSPPAPAAVSDPAGEWQADRLAGSAQPTWYFGEELHVDEAFMASEGAATTQIGIITPSGGVAWPAETLQAAPGGFSAVFAHPAAALGLVARGTWSGGPALPDGGAVRSGGRWWLLYGPLQDAVKAPEWRVGAAVGPFAGFAQSVVPPPVRIAHAPAGSHAHAAVVAADLDGTLTVAVHSAAGADLVRSETWLPGWEAVAAPLGADGRAGRPVPLPVTADGLVQEVHVPPGDQLVTFRYAPSSLERGVAISEIAWATLLVLAILWAAAALLRLRARPKPEGSS